MKSNCASHILRGWLWDFFFFSFWAKPKCEFYHWSIFLLLILPVKMSRSMTHRSSHNALMQTAHQCVTDQRKRLCFGAREYKIIRRCVHMGRWVRQWGRGRKKAGLVLVTRRAAVSVSKYGWQFSPGIIFISMMAWGFTSALDMKDIKITDY